MDNNEPGSASSWKERIAGRVFDPESVMIHKDTLLLIDTMYVMKTNGENLVELCTYGRPEEAESIDRVNEAAQDAAIGQTASTEEIRPMAADPMRPESPKKAFGSPFKSPVTANVVNMKLKFEERGSAMLNEAFSDDLGGLLRQKRKSSSVAEAKIRKQLEEEAVASKNECFVKTVFESMFCGISKPKKPLVKPETGPLDEIFNIKGASMPPDNQRVLCDKTNSPKKDNVPEKTVSDGAFNTKFFLAEDLEIENCRGEFEIEPVTVEDESSVEEVVKYLPPKSYYKEKETNTKLNEGYTTVEAKRKAVIEVFRCKKTFFRKNTRERRVYFDVDALNMTHNPGDSLEPIIEEQVGEPTFEWHGEKQVVEIIKRIDLGVESPPDDFIFRKVDRQIES